MAAQSELERIGIDERHNELGHADYNPSNAYSETHPDALGPDTPNANGDETGKGTGVSMTYSIPSTTKNPNSPISYRNMITDKGGSAVDINARNIQQGINLYGPNNSYGIGSVDTSANVAEGQYTIH